jgi:hypothetical protein
MTLHGRKRGDKSSYPICVWNGIFDHYEKIGTALWEFLWLIDAITEEQDGIGWVYGKAPLKIERIASDLGIGNSTVRRNLERLKNGGYITTRKARYGIIVGVTNSRKIRPQSSTPDRSKVSEQDSRPLKSEQSVCSKVSGLSTKSERTGDSILIDNAVRQSSKTRAACPVWQETGVDPTRLSGPFRKLCEELWPTRNGASLFDFMGVALDAWQALGNRSYPPAWVRRKAELRNGQQREQIQELEAEPWAVGNGATQ